MKHICILVPAGDAVVGSIEGPFKIFNQANELLAGMGRPPAFRVELVGLAREVTLNQGLFTLRPGRTVYEDDFQADLVVIPAPHGDLSEIVGLNTDAIGWMRRQYEGGAEVASLCMGAFLLAATGLLDGRRCTTHWVAAQQFRAMFPAVELLDERIITDERRLYSSGGAYSYLNLVLYLIEKYAGHELAVQVAKIYQIDMGRNSQQPFMIFRAQKEHEDPAIRKAQEFIETHFSARLSIEELAGMSFLGRRNFERRFKKATSNTVAEYIQRVKVEAAKQSLEAGPGNVAEVMYEVGYSDTKAFRKIFKKITGLAPVEYRQKYRLKVES